MMQDNFSTSWKESSQERKQHKYRYNAPLHIKQKMLHVHLSPELRKKYGFRNIQARKGDKVRVQRGQWKKKEGKIDRVNLKKEQIFVTGIEIIKKGGTKIPFALTPSNLMLIELDLADKKRKQKLEAKHKINKIKKGAAAEEAAAAEKTATSAKIQKRKDSTQ